MVALVRERNARGGEVGDWLSSGPRLIMLGLVVRTMTIIHFLPKFTNAVPSSFAAILVVSGIAFRGINTTVVADLASVQGGLPQFHLTHGPLSWATFTFIAPCATSPTS